VAQAVHASVAALWPHREETITQEYCGLRAGVVHEVSGPNRDDERKVHQTETNPQMHTVVLEAKDEAAVRKLAQMLDDGRVHYAMWTEQPENMVTALATKPYRRSDIQHLFKKFRLFK